MNKKPVMNKKLIVGNWKMNPVGWKEAKKTFVAIKKEAGKLRFVQTVLCPPNVYFGDLRREVTGHRCVLGAQNCFAADAGAYTGEVSPAQLTDLGVRYVILGHSERRALGETDDMIAEKIESALKNDMIVILCIGERARDASGDYLAYVQSQLRASLARVRKSGLMNVVIAYEPVWAIGEKATRSATPEDVVEMNIFIRKVLADMYGKQVAFTLPLLYGGSANEHNAKSFLTGDGSDGLLVGRASLDPARFVKILQVAENISKE